MRIFNLSRGSGKTIRMLYASEYHNVPILCTDETNKKYIMDMARWKNIHIPEPITVCDIVNHKTQGQGFNGVVVDDMDCVFQALLAQYRLDILGATITIDKECNNGQERKSINI